jgi:hypothetical protein
MTSLPAPVAASARKLRGLQANVDAKCASAAQPAR